MKLPTGLLLFCVVLTVSVWAEETAPVKNEVPEVKRELVWPEIKNPQALIDFAKAEISSFQKLHPGLAKNITTGCGPEFDYLKPLKCMRGDGRFIIIFDTHPFTGQGMIITPDPKEYWSLRVPQKEETLETKYPEIRFALGDLFWDASKLLQDDLKRVSVRWDDVQNLQKESRSWPKPLLMRFPAYPTILVEQGIGGSATVELTVTEEGKVAELKLECPLKEMEPFVREAMSDWRFEPGVDLTTRLPAPTRISLTVKFHVDDN